MKKIIFLTALFLSHYSFAQSNFGFEFDFAQFGYDSTSNYLECYYSFSQGTMSIEQTDTANYVQGKLHITLQDTTTGEVAVDKDWLVSHIVSGDTIQNYQSLIGVLGFVLKTGTYKCVVTGIDALSPENQRTITEYIKIRPFLSMPLAMSDVQLASNMIQNSENKNSIFYKNTYEVVPSPTAIYGTVQPVLFYYVELYNMNRDNSNFYLYQNVLNSRGQVVSNKARDIKNTANSIVQVGNVMAYKLPTDSYSLVISLVDSTTNFGISSAKKFFVYNPSVEYVDTFNTGGNKNVVAGMFGAMSDEELDDFYNKSKYIASSQEKQKYESLTEVGAKREFLTQFWDARDDEINDGKNQTLVLYIKRIKESNERFGGLSKEGWKTDRGRVYIIYGEPSEISRYPNQIETKPYEIWRYDNIEGGVEFDFGDLTGFSDYMLLNSTKRGELRDDNWLNRLAVH